MDRTIFDRLREMRPAKGKPLSALIVQACDAGDELVDALAQARQVLATYQPDSAPTFYMEAIWNAEAALAHAHSENGDTPTNGAKAA